MGVTKEDALPKPILFLKRNLEKILAKIYRPIDLPDRRINIKIIDQKNCPKRYQIGRVFKFNPWNRNEICPAGFAQMYPLLTQPKTKAKIFVACPDDNVVIYQIIKR
jgi:uncharacterized repeat protein (TIGR04076 family)